VPVPARTFEGEGASANAAFASPCCRSGNHRPTVQSRADQDFFGSSLAMVGPVANGGFRPDGTWFRRATPGSRRREREEGPDGREYHGANLTTYTDKTRVPPDVWHDRIWPAPASCWLGSCRRCVPPTCPDAGPCARLCWAGWRADRTPAPITATSGLPRAPGGLTPESAICACEGDGRPRGAPPRRPRSRRARPYRPRATAWPGRTATDRGRWRPRGCPPARGSG